MKSWAAYLCAAVGLAAPGAAQDGIKLPALNQNCGVPIARLATLAPLPNLAAALKRKTTLDFVAIGSSSTYGIGASALERTYPAQLQDILERTFKGYDIYISNSGVGGEVAAQTAQRVRNEATLKRPDLVLWQVGTNEVLAGVSLPDFKETVQDTIRWLKERRIDTVLIGLQYGPAVEKNDRHKIFGQAIAEITAAENVPLVRRYDAMHFLATSRWENLLSGDGLHQNDQGYRCMAEHVARTVVMSALLPRADEPSAVRPEAAGQLKPMP